MKFELVWLGAESNTVMPISQRGKLEGSRSDGKLLQNPNEHYEDLHPGKTLTETRASSKRERNDLWRINELSVLVDMTIWVELMRIWPSVWIKVSGVNVWGHLIS